MWCMHTVYERRKNKWRKIIMVTKNVWKREVWITHLDSKVLMPKGCKWLDQLL